MPTGKLKMYNADRGFGFITDDSGGPDIFVHVSALQRSGLDPENLKLGTRFTYSVEQGRGGKVNAIEVHEA